MSSSDTSYVSKEKENMQTAEDDEQELPQSRGNKTYDFSTKTWREDMELIVEGRKLFVASNILSLLSPVFTSMFDEQFKGGGPKVIELPGKKINDVTEFLRCIYPNIRKTVSADNVQNIIPLADEFKVIELKQACEDFLIEATSDKTTPNDICLRLQLAYRHRLNDLKEKCLKRAASIDSDTSTAAETKYHLPLEIKIQIKDVRIVQLSKTVSQLQTRESDLRNTYRNLIDVVKYFWIEKGWRNDSFAKGDFGALTLTIKDVRTLDTKYSPLEHAKGIDWCIYVEKKKNDDGVEYLSVYVSADAPTPWKDWSCDFLSKIMIPDNTGKQGKEMGLQHTFTPESTCVGYPEFITINELLSKQKGFVVDDVLTIKVFFFAKEPVSKPFVRKRFYLRNP